MYFALRIMHKFHITCYVYMSYYVLHIHFTLHVTFEFLPVHDGGQNYTKDMPNSWMSLDLKRFKLSPTHYCLRSGIDNGDHKLCVRESLSVRVCK